MSFTLVHNNLLIANNLQDEHIYSLLDHMHNKNIDYGDLYFQSYYNEEWLLEDNIIKNGSYNFDQGVGIRVINGEKTGFSYTDNLTMKALHQSIITARSIITNITNKSNQSLKRKILQKVLYSNIYPKINPISSFSKAEKIELLHRINNYARTIDSRVQKVRIKLSTVYEEILIIATDGTLAKDIRPQINLLINVQVEENGKREYGSSGCGGRMEDDFLFKIIDGEVFANILVKEAVHMALINLGAIPSPAGLMTVILGPGWPGILLHEAVGHGLEGDFNRRGSSVFNNKLGQMVASELCTIIDDGTLKNKHGSISIDDEGVPGQYNILIEKGILKKYMQDKLNAKLMNMSSTGNGRRQSYAYLPMPRMTNTYMLPGQSKPDDIIKSVDYGIYAKNFGGGQVDITSGKFVFSTSEAYLIKNGHITKPIKGATLIGSGIEVMQQISMVGNDFALDRGIGMCGKEGQNIPVGVGQPTLKINQMTVGGTI